MIKTSRDYRRPPSLPADHGPEDDGEADHPIQLDQRTLAFARAVEDEAMARGVVEAGIAIHLVDPGRITIGPDGRVRGAREAVSALAAKFPKWFAGPRPGGTPSRPTPHPGSPGRPTRDLEIMQAMIKSGAYSRM